MYSAFAVMPVPSLAAAGLESQRRLCLGQRGQPRNLSPERSERPGDGMSCGGVQVLIVVHVSASWNVQANLAASWQPILRRRIASRWRMCQSLLEKECKERETAADDSASSLGFLLVPAVSQAHSSVRHLHFFLPGPGGPPKSVKPDRPPRCSNFTM